MHYKIISHRGQFNNTFNDFYLPLNLSYFNHIVSFYSVLRMYCFRCTILYVNAIWSKRAYLLTYLNYLYQDVGGASLTSPKNHICPPHLYTVATLP